MAEQSIRELVCLIEGDDTLFKVKVAANTRILGLKKIILEEGVNVAQPILARDLKLWKVDIDLAGRTRDSFRQIAIGEDDGNQMLESKQVSELWQEQPASGLHILVKLPPTTATTFSPKSSKKSNLSGFTGNIRCPSKNDGILARLHELHRHLWGKDRIDHRDDLACSTLDLAPFKVLNLNIHPDDILLVRNEYVLAYNDIVSDIHNLTPGWRRSATLVTGQPEIGKTFFLFYVLARRLHDQKPVAFQINEHKFALFCQDGVTLHSTEKNYMKVPEGAWALSDSGSDVSSRRSLCMAFQQLKFHVVHTGSPSSHRWMGWVERIGARKYVMDVWSPEEFRTLLALNKFDVRKGQGLFEKYGPSLRTIIHILVGNVKEDTYEREVKAAASRLAAQFSAVVPELYILGYIPDISTMIFTIKPKNDVSREQHTFYISTPFLCRTFGLAMSRQEAVEQNAFFRIMISSSHPSFSAAGGWLFQHYAHNCLSQPTREPLKVHNQDGTICHIPMPAKIIAGSTALKCIQPLHDFYWRPVNPVFEGVDAIIRSGNNVWALQYTISGKHKDATDGLIKIRDRMNHKRNVKWHLVMVGPNLTGAKEARDDQKLDGWKWSTVQVYASELPLGQFDYLHAQRLETILNDANETDSASADQSTDSGDPMDGSL